MGREVGNGSQSCSTPVGPIPYYTQTLLRLTFVSPNGTETEFRDQQTDGEPLALSCSAGLSRGTVFTSTDGSSAVFVSDTANGSYISTKRQYDGLGRLQLQFNPARPGDGVAFSTNVYDGLSRMISFRAQDGATTSIAYAGNVTTTTDPAGNIKRVTADADGRVVRVLEDPSGLDYLTTYSYDPLGDLVEVQQGVQIRSYVYNAGKWLLQSTDPEVGQITYSYDSDGNLVSRTDNRGIRTSFSYDADDRLIQKSYSDGTPSVTYAYDDTTVANSLGHLTNMTSSVSTMSYTAYDALGRVAATKQSTNSHAYSIAYSYDLAGAISTETYPSGRIVANSFDSAGRITAVTGRLSGQNSRYVSNIQYAAHGAVDQFSLGNGLSGQNQFNARLQPAQISVGTSAVPTSILGLSYVYNALPNDDNGSLRSASIALPGVAQPIYQAYYYDHVNRLVEAVENSGWYQNYGYDQYGNRAVVAGLLPTPALTPQSVVAFNAKNQISSLSYDAAGNMTFDGFRTIAYDAETRQAQVTLQDSSVVYYEYDGEGLRVSQTFHGITTVYVRDIFGQLVGEYSNGSASPGTLYVHSDYLGSVRATTDISGNTISRHDYLPFGEELQSSTGARSGIVGYGSGDALRQRFTGKERDSETALDYFGARYLSSTQGRFSSPDDPLTDQHAADPESWNLYSYVHDKPLSLVDPSGRLSIEPRGPAATQQSLRIERPEDLTLTRGLDMLSNVGGFAEALIPGVQIGTKVVPSGGGFLFSPIYASEPSWLQSLGATASLVRYVQSTAGSLTDSSLTLTQRAENQASASGNLLVHAGGLSNVYFGAFVSGWDLGSSLYQNIPSFKHAADTAVTDAGSAILGRRGFAQWSSRPSWIDNINRPGTVIGNIFSWF